MNNIELITCDNGDWEVLKLNGRLFAEGHSLSNQDWIDLIYQMTNKVTVNQKVVSEEEMEEGNY